jgi:hypothetical protein
MISTKPVSMNAYVSIRDNFDAEANLADESDRQSQKYFSPKTSTDEGRMISIKPVRMNVCISIRDNLDPDSNVTEENDRH